MNRNALSTLSLPTRLPDSPLMVPSKSICLYDSLFFEKRDYFALVIKGSERLILLRNRQRYFQVYNYFFLAFVLYSDGIWNLDILIFFNFKEVVCNHFFWCWDVGTKFGLLFVDDQSSI